MVGKAGRRIIKIPRFEVLIEGRPWLPRNQNGPAAGLLAGWVFLKRKISPKILKILVLSIYCFGLTRPDSDMMYLLYYYTKLEMEYSFLFFFFSIGPFHAFDLITLFLILSVKHTWIPFLPRHLIINRP